MERRHRVGFEVFGVLFSGFAVIGGHAALYPLVGLWLMTVGLLRSFPSGE
ncbi:hypothetical protein [Halorussus halophilus]|nr:hypothetical protein [Halorussus halophilus]